VSTPLDGVAAPGLVSDASGKNEELAANGRKLALAVYVTLKSALLYDVNNRFWDRPLGMFEEVVKWHFGEGVGKPLALASIEKALFLNGTLVRLDAGSYGAMRFVSRAFDQMSIEEIAFVGPVSADDLRPLVNVVRDALRARSGEPLLEAAIPGIRFRRKVEREREDLDKHRVDPRVAAVQAYATCAATSAEFRSLFLAGGNPSIVRLKRAAQELVTSVIKYPDLVVGLTQLPRLRGTAAGHMTNCAAFALLIARKLALPRRSFGELALNAMLAPLGVAARDAQAQAVDAKNGTVGGAHDAVARMSAAVAMMKRYGALARPALVRSAIVHERSDANGQAYRLGMKPHLFSRVIAVAAAYDLANQEALPDEALRRVVAQSRNGALDADVVALLSEALGLYPVGSTVKLSDGTTAVVVQAPRDPSRRASPVVRVLQGTGGRLVDLAQGGGRLSITATVSPESQQINVAHCFLL
jgi:hypothetical protein